MGSRWAAGRWDKIGNVTMTQSRDSRLDLLNEFWSPLSGHPGCNGRYAGERLPMPFMLPVVFFVSDHAKHRT